MTTRDLRPVAPINRLNSALESGSYTVLIKRAEVSITRQTKCEYIKITFAINGGEFDGIEIAQSYFPFVPMFEKLINCIFTNKTVKQLRLMDIPLDVLGELILEKTVDVELHVKYVAGIGKWVPSIKRFWTSFENRNTQ